MAHNQLSEKLDLITDAELNTDFDPSALWSRLEDRLEERNSAIYWRTVAACILVLTFFLPISILKETETRIQTQAISEMVEAAIDPSLVKSEEANEIIQKEQYVEPFRSLEKKGAELSIAQISATVPMLEPIALSENKKGKAAFAPEDISIIQASLEKPKIRKGRTMTIRAQWQKSPTKSNVEHQTVKIKLYEKDK